MGFIKDNTNTFEVYLTDLGKEKFFDGGFRDSIVYFSVCDGDSNYDIMSPNPNNILPYDNTTTYNYNNIVSYNGDYYRYKYSPASGNLPTNQTYWDKVTLFNPTVITPQPIPTINHNGTKLTSIDGGYYINDVFIQVPLRGAVADNIQYHRALLGTKQNTQRDYIMHEPDINTNQTLNILTYINV